MNEMTLDTSCKERNRRECRQRLCLTRAFFVFQNCFDSIDSMIMQASRIAIGIAAAIVGFEVTLSSKHSLVR